MVADDALSQLRVHDPARHLPERDERRRERLRASIVASAPATAQRRRFGRPLVLVAAATAALAVAGAGWAVHRALFSTPAQVRDEFANWTQRVPLPPGAAWQQPNLDETALYGDNAAAMVATGEATCAWYDYWLDARRRNDAAALSRAAAGIARVRALLPVHPVGAPEEAGGYSADSLAFYDRIIADQRRLDAATTRQYVRANCR